MEYGIAPAGYRLPAATRLGRVRLQIADLDRSIAYYETVIGLRVLDRTAAMTELYVSSVMAPYLQPLVDRAWLDPQGVTTLDRLLSQTPLGDQIVAFKVWSTDGKVLYSPNHALIGRSFEIDDDLARGNAAATLDVSVATTQKRRNGQ